MPTYMEAIETKIDLFYSCIMSGRAEEAKDYVTSNFVLEEALELPYSQSKYNGLTEVSNFFKELNTLIEIMGTPEIKISVPSASLAFAVISFPVKVRKTGVEFKFEAIEMLSIVDGRIAYVKPHYFRQKPFLDVIQNSVST
ncbi:hypothetical protein NEOLI_001020 [Neolecta irregularis DAH-3]|uniref:SnoaL-like domain-containing protein n=1 Tax=Neolecta irregularis (strain DAH-3) TaxID=1198029 RepID=A0A1U7LGT0_NEOID|nr:hypothetical protein NEOLI_001020 [Neolecta irregularis DAH-3]|eukprot:OLL21803.1 hypothetical protein NEOLI_001020 [Neolecta irregularis DAH-3]